MNTVANVRANGSSYYQLQEKQPVRLSAAMGHEVECLSGGAWITAYGANDDVLLRQGQRYVIPNNGLALIEAVGSGRVRVRATAAVPQPWLQKLALHPQAA